MYHWTHIELARHQPNGHGPKTDSDEIPQNQSDNEEFYNDSNNSTVIVASQERGESFATVKHKLLLCETATKTSGPETGVKNENQQSNQNGDTQDGSVETAQIDSDVLNGHRKNNENSQQNCDRIDKVFVEISTQTDDTMEKMFKEQKSTDSQARPAPPPPPPPPPPLPQISLPSITISDETNKPTNEKPIATEQAPVTPQQTNSQINISSTKLSSASSFCPPPPPPMNGVPGPPPLPLPSGNSIWFQSDSKLSDLICISVQNFIISRFIFRYSSTKSS